MKDIYKFLILLKYFIAAYFILESIGLSAI